MVMTFTLISHFERKLESKEQVYFKAKPWWQDIDLSMLGDTIVIHVEEGQPENAAFNCCNNH